MRASEEAIFVNEMKLQMSRFQQLEDAHVWVIYSWFEEQNPEYSDRVEMSRFNHWADRHFESSQRSEIIVFYLFDRANEISSQREQIFISH